MKRIFILLICLSAVCHVRAQNDQPTAAPKISAFNLNADNLGAIANSVNLFTGDIAFPMNIVSIPGQGGIGIDVSLFYSSANMENIAGVWNLDAPTGTIGLGWSMPISQIVVDNKQTGARDDDEFYLVDGGSSTRLVCVGNSAGVKSYQTKTYSNSIITYTAGTESWEITKDDGTKAIYGDQNSGRSTVQWIVKWGNWIGSSKLADNQSRQGMVWNISELKNLWGGRVYYSYSNVENAVGEGTLQHTEASYLTNISDSWGHSVDLIYKEKQALEFTEPHTEQPEPDAFQERYEKKFLDKIVVKIDGTISHEVSLRYSTNELGSGNLSKRLLKTLTKYTSTGTALPATSFVYLTSGNMKGVLNVVKTQTGESVTFEYETNGFVINHSDRELPITAPANYAEPRVFIEDDYTIVTWREYNGSAHALGNKQTLVEIYTWEGKWRKDSPVENIGPTRLVDGNDNGLVDNDDLNNQDFLVATGKDFFGILKPVYGGTHYLLHLWHRDQRLPGEWIAYSQDINLDVPDDYDQEQLFAGDNFIAVSNGKGKIVRYTWNGDWTRSDVNETTGSYYVTATNNFIISHYASPNPDQLKIYYLDELGTWQSKALTTSFNNGGLSAYWHSSRSMAVAMLDANNEYIIRWDEEYNLSQTNTGLQLADNSTVFMLDESQISFVPPSASNIRALRFNGSGWTDTGSKTVYDPASISVGIDYLLWHPNSAVPAQTANRKFYNPNSGSWNSDISVSYSSNIIRSTEAGFRSFVQNNRLYFSQSNGSWVDVASPISMTNQASSRLGPNYFAVSTNGLILYFLKNGQLLPDAVGDLDQRYYVSNSSQSYYHALIGNNTIVTTSNDPNDFASATALKLYRIINYKITGKQIDYPIVKVTVDDGNQTSYTSFNYYPTVVGPTKTVLTATSDPSGTYAQYNKVGTISNGMPDASKPFGFTDSFFFNSLTDTELTDNFPDASTVPYSAIDLNFKLATGMTYRTKVFNSNSPNADLVSEQSTTYTFPEYTIRDITNVRDIDKGKMPVLYLSSSKQDNMSRVKFYEYNPKYQVSRVREYDELTLEVYNLNEFTYAWEVTEYAGMLTKNMLSPVVATVALSNQLLPTDINITRWKEWPCSGSNCMYANIPAPVDQYKWKKGRPTYFNVWNTASEPASTDWQFLGKSNVIDNASGIALEQQQTGGQLSTQLLDEKKRAVIASVINAGTSQIAYTSFEDAATGNWSWSDGAVTTGTSKTGEKYLNLGTSGMSRSGLNSAERYTISLWIKSAGGSVIIDGVGSVNLGSLSGWTLFEYTVTGLASISVRKSGSAEVLVDEVRLHPYSARMSTTTYHPLFGTTSQTDPNNQTTYTEYDDTGKPKNIRDENKNIVETYLYNFKK